MISAAFAILGLEKQDHQSGQVIERQQSASGHLNKPPAVRLEKFKGENPAQAVEWAAQGGGGEANGGGGVTVPGGITSLDKANEECQRVDELNERWKRIFKLQQTVGEQGQRATSMMGRVSKLLKHHNENRYVKRGEVHKRWDKHFSLHYVFDCWICALENGIYEIAQSGFNICMEMKLTIKQYTHFSLI